MCQNLNIQFSTYNEHFPFIPVENTEGTFTREDFSSFTKSQLDQILNPDIVRYLTITNDSTVLHNANFDRIIDDLNKSPKMSPLDIKTLGQEIDQGHVLGLFNGDITKVIAMIRIQIMQDLLTLDGKDIIAVERKSLFKALEAGSTYKKVFEIMIRSANDLIKKNISKPFTQFSIDFPGEDGINKVAELHRQYNTHNQRTPISFADLKLLAPQLLAQLLGKGGAEFLQKHNEFSNFENNYFIVDGTILEYLENKLKEKIAKTQQEAEEIKKQQKMLDNLTGKMKIMNPKKKQ